MFIVQVLDEKGRWIEAMSVEFKEVADAKAIADMLAAKGQYARVIDKDLLRFKKQPCYKCERRVPGCHGSCEDYKLWTQVRDLRRVPKTNIAEEYWIDKTWKKK